MFPILVTNTCFQDNNFVVFTKYWKFNTDITIEAKGWVAGEGIAEDIVDSKRNSYFTVISFFNGDTSVSTWSRPSS